MTSVPLPSPSSPTSVFLSNFISFVRWTPLPPCRDFLSTELSSGHLILAAVDRHDRISHLEEEKPPQKTNFSVQVGDSVHIRRQCLYLLSESEYPADLPSLLSSSATPPCSQKRVIMFSTAYGFDRLLSCVGQEGHEDAQEELLKKVKFFLSTAVQNWEAEFYVTVNDNIDIDLEGLIVLLEHRRGQDNAYIGCINLGEVEVNGKSVAPLYKFLKSEKG